MRFKSKYFQLMLLMAFSMSSICVSQSKTANNEFRYVKYKDNVNQPLTANELRMIQEVYGDKTEEYVLNRPQRLKSIKHILRNRVSIELISDDKKKKPCPLLSEVPLMDYYVTDIKRDTKFNPNNFNPLKYLFEFYANGAKLYRVDNTNYYIYIKSQFSN